MVADRYNALDPTNSRPRFAVFAQLQEELPEQEVGRLTTRGATLRIRVVHAVSLSLSLRQKQDGVHFDSVLFDRGIAERRLLDDAGPARKYPAALA